MTALTHRKHIKFTMVLLLLLLKYHNGTKLLKVSRSPILLCWNNEDIIQLRRAKVAKYERLNYFIIFISYPRATNFKSRKKA